MEALRCNVFVPLPLNIVWNYWPQVLLDNVAHQSFPKKLVKGQGAPHELVSCNDIVQDRKEQIIDKFWCWQLGLLCLKDGNNHFWGCLRLVWLAPGNFFLTYFLWRTPNHSRRIQQLQLLSSATQTCFLFLLAHGNPMKKLSFSLTCTDHLGRNVFLIFPDAAIVFSKTLP